MRVPYTWLLEYLEADTPAEELAHVLTMGGLEVEGVQEWVSEDGEATDKVLLTKITANRGDLLSMVGVARQAAALLGCGWHMPVGAPPISGAPLEGPNAKHPAQLELAVGAPLVAQGDVQVEVLDFEGCPRYSALAIRDLRMGASPAWLRHRLESAGLRPLSNVVDVTNYVCWELGQPMHAFDLRLLARNHIIVRRAQPGEELMLIDESLLKLHERDLLICDEMGPVALAGVMGGKDTEMRDRTAAVLLESAHFNPTSVRRSAQRHGMSSESAYRFERFVDPNLTVRALARARDLILQTAGGTPDPVALDVRQEDFVGREVSLRPARCNKLLGTDLSEAQMTDCLARLGFEVRGGATDGAFQVEVPTFRPDVEREVDLIEEVAIVSGYNNIPLTVPGRLTESGLLTAGQRFERRARELLRQGGLNETISFSFMGPADLDRCGFGPQAPERRALALLLPVAPELSHLRTTLIPGLLSACAANVRQRALDVALYELDRVFIERPGEELPQEELRVAGLLMGATFTSRWNLPEGAGTADFFALKGVVEQLCAGLNVAGVEFLRAAHPTFHPGRCAEVRVGGEVVGVLGEVAAAVQEAYDLPAKPYLFELKLQALRDHARAHREYDPLPRFPAALRDLALLVADDEAHSAAALAGAIREAGGQTLWTVEAFDLYVDRERLGPGMKSLAFRMTFRAADRTLTDQELDEALARVAAHLAEKLGAQVRDR